MTDNGWFQYAPLIVLIDRQKAGRFGRHSCLAAAVGLFALLALLGATQAPAEEETEGQKASKEVLGLFRPGAAPPTWFFRRLGKGEKTLEFSFATAEDKPVLGDWDNDGADTVGVFRPSNATWYLKNENSAGGHDISFAYAFSTDVPVVGDWDGDGDDTVGVFRPSNATWYLKNANQAGPQDIRMVFGLTGDRPVVGDWNGDGKDGVGVFRPSNARWYLRNSLTSGGNEIPSFAFANPGDRPVTGDWDEDGLDTAGVFRPGNATWYFRNSFTSGPADETQVFGSSDDLPIVGRFTW